MWIRKITTNKSGSKQKSSAGSKQKSSAGSKQKSSAGSKQKLSLGQTFKQYQFKTKLILIGIAIIFIMILTQYISFKTKFGPLFKWWKDNNGKQYDNLFNIGTMVAARNNRLIYFFYHIKDPPLRTFTKSQYLFIINSLLPFINYKDSEGIERGILTPQRLCNGIMFSVDDNPKDARFDHWINNTTPTRIGTTNTKGDKGVPYTVSAGLAVPYGLWTKIPGPENPDNKDQTLYFYIIDTKLVAKGNIIGIYPNREDRQGWAGLVLYWCNGHYGPKNPKTGGEALWCYAVDKSKGITELIPNPLCKKCDSSSEWLKSEDYNDSAGNPIYTNGKPENFLSRFGILPNNPIFTFWFNNKYSGNNGMKVDNSSFEILLQTASTNAGGWVGFLFNEDKFSQAEYTSLIYSTTNYTPPDPPPPCQKPSIGSAILSGLAAFGAVAVMAAMGGITGGAAIGVGIAALVNGASTVASKLQSNC